MNKKNAYKETFFSPAIRFVERFKNILTGIEYMYESSTIPVRIGKSYVLSYDNRHFVKLLKNRARSLFTKKTEYLDITVRGETLSKTNKPKVIHFIVWLGGMGGAPRLILEIANGLKDKYEMEGITISDLFYYKYSNFKVTHFNTPEKTVEYLKEYKPDIIHTYYYGDWEKYHQYFDALLCANLKAKIIENLLVPIHTYRSPKIDHYVFCSKYIRNIQHKKFTNESVIYPGTDTEEFKPTNRKKLPNSIGMVYRLWNDKIDQSTIEMFISLAKRRPATLVYIIGGGFNFHHYVERTRQEGVRENFYFTGEIGYKELPKWYDKIGVFVAPVHTESYGMVVPYAMAKEIPVVAYRRGALPEILGDSNVLVNTSPEMVEALIDILDNPQKVKALTINSRKRVIEKFSNEKMLRDYDLLYKSLLNKK